MSRSLTDKLTRVLTFLVHVRQPAVRNLLAPRGFDQAALDEGWQLFTRAAGAHPELPMADEVDDTRDARQLLAKLDAWENTWVPLIDATLQRHAPELHQHVFHGVRQSRGLQVVVTIGTVLDRLDAVRSAASRGDHMQALALLRHRGLTAEVVEQARALLDEIKRLDERDTSVDQTAESAAQERAVDEMWGWYREWSHIARTVITRGDLLQRLGLRRRGRRKSNTTRQRSAADAHADRPGQGA